MMLSTIQMTSSQQAVPPLALRTGRCRPCLSGHQACTSI